MIVCAWACVCLCVCVGFSTPGCLFMLDSLLHYKVALFSVYSLHSGYFCVRFSTVTPRAGTGLAGQCETRHKASLHITGGSGRMNIKNKH